MTRGKRSSGLATRSETNQAVQPQKLARGLKFRIKQVEGFYCLCSENKEADQLTISHDAAQIMYTLLPWVSLLKYGFKEF